MIYALSGTVRKLTVPTVTVDVSGVQYLLSVPYPLWDALHESKEATITIFTYVREDRLDLFGFANGKERELFVQLINLSGVGPKLALELCSVPRAMFATAIINDDVSILTAIKGVGKKTAEKLLVDLKSLFEKHPEWMAETKAHDKPAAFDTDAVSALTSLGYDHPSILSALKNIPSDLKRTEDRVAAALRSL
jgi:Holliday junction DNA helicase RuvA